MGIYLEFTVMGEPVPQGRPRFRKLGNYVTTYDPVKSKKYKELIKNNIEPLNDKIDVPISVTLNVYRSIPKCTPKKLKAKMVAGLVRPTKKPDVDNYAKSVLDALTGVLWTDDSIIVRLVINKYYSENPRIELFVTDNVN